MFDLEGIKRINRAALDAHDPCTAATARIEKFLAEERARSVRQASKDQQRLAGVTGWINGRQAHNTPQP